MYVDTIISLFLSVITTIFLKKILLDDHSKKRHRRNRSNSIDQKQQIDNSDFNFNYPECGRIIPSLLHGVGIDENEKWTEVEKIMVENNRKKAKVYSKLAQYQSSKEIYKINGRIILRRNAFSSTDVDADFQGTTVKEALAVLPELLTKADVSGRKSFTIKIGGPIDKETKLIDSIRKWLETETVGFERPTVGKFIIYL